ncbi:unnamed protein product [Effrenium voratum]|nr:unnamed protein product [Effrenium voratum]
MDPGTIFHLSKLSLLQDAEEGEVDHPTGEVLFRQGDDPVDCYVVMRGAVEVWIRKDAQTSPRDFTEDDVVVTQEQKRRGCRCFRRKKDEAVMELNDSERKYVTEGFNTFGASSDLGTMVAVLKRGTAFGELGLMERKPRAASIRCAQKCTFLVIRRSAFHKWFSESMGADAYRKRIFFIRKIPGFRYETLRRNAHVTQGRS